MILLTSNRDQAGNRLLGEKKKPPGYEFPGAGYRELLSYQLWWQRAYGQGVSRHCRWFLPIPIVLIPRCSLALEPAAFSLSLRG